MTLMYRRDRQAALARAVAVGLIIGFATISCSDSGTEPSTSATEESGSAGKTQETNSLTMADLDEKASEAWFEEVSTAWGLSFVHDAGKTPEKHLPETMGAGAALFDADFDGDLDIYCVQSGAMPVGALVNLRDTAAPNQLFLWDSDRFRDVTATSGDAAHRGYGMGVAAGDVDGDRFTDLYVTNLGPDVLLHGQVRASFKDVTQASGLGDPRWTTGAVLFDPDADGDLDLYVLGYLDVDLEHPVWCGRREEGWRAYCHPDQYDGIADRFYINDGRGRFEDATQAAGLESNLGKGLGVAVFDFDDDGAVDLYVANDSVENRMWRGLGDGRFEDATLTSGTGVNANGSTEAGMGVATGDVDGDGRVDLIVTNFDEESNTLYRNDGDGLFTDVTSRRGLDAASRMPVGFGTVLADFDRDGDLDLAVTNGHIVDNIGLYHDGKTHAQASQLFENLAGKRFEERKASVLSREALVGRGLYAGDIDGDGWIDLLLTQCDGPARLYRNRLGQAAPERVRPWIIRGAPSGSRFWLYNRDGSVIVRDASTQNSYLGCSGPRVHLDVAGAEVERLEFRFPGGPREQFDLSYESPGFEGILDVCFTDGRLRIHPLLHIK